MILQIESYILNHISYSIWFSKVNHISYIVYTYIVYLRKIVVYAKYMMNRMANPSPNHSWQTHQHVDYCSFQMNNVVNTRAIESNIQWNRNNHPNSSMFFEATTEKSFF
jgi:uncharacterized membrane protein required for colicin V production